MRKKFRIGNGTGGKPFSYAGSGIGSYDGNSGLSNLTFGVSELGTVQTEKSAFARVLGLLQLTK